jgi:hypothetical protein
MTMFDIVAMLITLTAFFSYPHCSSHTPGHGSMEQLSGSACHGCLYISETSCEQFNRYLDRSLVVSTIEQLGCELFTQASSPAIARGKTMEVEFDAAATSRFFRLRSGRA